MRHDHSCDAKHLSSLSRDLILGSSFSQIECVPYFQGDFRAISVIVVSDEADYDGSYQGQYRLK